METSESYRALVVVAERMLAGQIGVIDGSRQLVAIGSQTELYENDKFMVFRAIDSESEDLPIGQVRQYWNEDALKGKDNQIEEYEASVRDTALEACQELVNVYKTDN